MSAAASTSDRHVPVWTGFLVRRRDYGHWDIIDHIGGRRLFAIRGGPGKYKLLDTRVGETAKEWPAFKSLSAAMAAACDDLMWENIAVEGQPPHLIEPWNV